MADTIIKENSKFRITQVETVKNSSLFVEGKNIFGRWVIIQTIDRSELEANWSRCEDVAAQFTK